MPTWWLATTSEHGPTRHYISTAGIIAATCLHKGEPQPSTHASICAHDDATSTTFPCVGVVDMRVGTCIPLVARCDTIPAQRRKTPATCREPCLPNRHPSPDTATTTSIAPCGTIPAQRHISAQPAGTKARRLVRASRTRVPTLRTTSRRRCCYRGSIRILYKHMRDVIGNAIVPQHYPCVGVAHCATRPAREARRNAYMRPRPPRTRTPMLVLATRRGTNSRHLPAQRRCTVNTPKHLTQIRLLLLLAFPDTAPYRHSNNQSPQPAYTKARSHARMPAFATHLQASVHA